MDLLQISSIVIIVLGILGVIIPLINFIRQIKDEIEAVVDALEPDANGTVDITQAEIQRIIDEWDDIKPAALKLWDAIKGIVKWKR
jgi:predicted PurR-regulated permease PerM